VIVFLFSLTLFFITRKRTSFETAYMKNLYALCLKWLRLVVVMVGSCKLKYENE